jgi:hypothetical protein
MHPVTRLLPPNPGALQQSPQNAPPTAVPAWYSNGEVHTSATTVATPIPILQPLIPKPRTRANRANARLSTGPPTPAGKQRSSLNALRHGLTAASAVLPSEDPAAYEQHRRRFFDEYQPATPTESQLVQELVDTSWRLNRIPLLEAATFARHQPPATNHQPPADIVDAHRLLANLGIQGQRLSRSSKRASTRSATSKPAAPSASAATSTTPPPSSNSTNTKEFPASRPTMASFFQKTA